MGIVEDMVKWDQRFLEMAKLVSTWSKDPSTKVGAVITDSNNRVISVGYNGFPKHIKDDEDLLKDRSIKLSTTIHAETNAILFSNTNLEGCSIYTYPFMPCSNCASLIIQSGITRVITISNDSDLERFQRWKESIELSSKMFQEAGVKLRFYADNIK